MVYCRDCLRKVVDCGNTGSTRPCRKQSKAPYNLCTTPHLRNNRLPTIEKKCEVGQWDTIYHKCSVSISLVSLEILIGGLKQWLTINPWASNDRTRAFIAVTINACSHLPSFKAYFVALFCFTKFHSILCCFVLLC